MIMDRSYASPISWSRAVSASASSPIAVRTAHTRLGGELDVEADGDLLAALGVRAFDRPAAACLHRRGLVLDRGVRGEPEQVEPGAGLAGVVAAVQVQVRELVATAAVVVLRQRAVDPGQGGFEQQGVVAVSSGATNSRERRTRLNSRLSSAAFRLVPGPPGNRPSRRTTRT